jgi:ATP phosphoribosyltransferase regulatory subunit HisZ
MKLIQRVDAALKQSGNEALADELKAHLTQLCDLVSQLQELYEKKDQLVKQLCAAYEQQLHKAAEQLMTPKELRDAAWRKRFYRP